MNKIWNAGKFITINKLEEGDSKISVDTFYDAWIVDRFNNLLDKYNIHLENCEVEKAAYELYHFFWDDFCDWYIEIAKISFSNFDNTEADNTKLRMETIFTHYLNILYPFAPFLSLELNSYFKKDKIVEKFNELPKKLGTNYSGDYKSEIQLIKDFTNAIRSLRKNLLIKPAEKLSCYCVLTTVNRKFLEDNSHIIEKLCNLDNLILIEEENDLNLISNITPSGIVSFLKNNNLDFSAQIEKLNKDLISLEKTLTLSKSKLNSKGFLESAPEHIIEEEKIKLNHTNSLATDIRNLISQLN